MKLSDSSLITLRNRPHKTRLHLSIFTPKVVMRCRVNDASISKGARTITYDTVSFGDYSSVEAGMTLLIGTTDGGEEKGRIRIRSVDASQFVISENSNIAWEDALYLTVLRYWEVWPVYPRIIQDPSNQENVIFYKDYDIEYSNQNSVLGTFVCAGPHKAAFLDSGEAKLYYSASGTYNFKGDSLSYEWAFEGGTPTGSTSNTPGYISYITPGHYVTRLTVSGTGGSVDTTYRYVSIYEKPEDGSNNPILHWNISQVQGSRGEGGYSAKITVYDSIPNIRDGSLVVIFAEDWYGTEQQSLGGNSINASDIFIVGYILEGSIQWNYADSSVSFTIGCISHVMKKSVGFSVSVESKSSPSVWYELLDMDTRRAIYHYLRWHSTVLSTTDFEFVGDDRAIQYFDSDRESLFDAIDNFLKNTLIGDLVSDRQGKLWAEVSIEATPNATGTFPPVMEITKRDWMNTPIITERHQDDFSYLEYGGIAYSGSATGTFSALMACAPGNAPAFRGKIERQQGLALLGQPQLNQLVGNVLAHKNAKYPTIEMYLSGNYRNLDIAPQEAVRLQISPEDTAKGISIDSLYSQSDVTWIYDAEHGFLHPRSVFSAIVSGEVGDTITIPEAPSDGEYGTNNLKIPSIPPLTITPFLGALTNKSIFMATGTVSQDPILNLPMSIDGVAINYNAGANFDWVEGDYWVSVKYSGIYYVEFFVTINSATTDTTGWIAVGDYNGGNYYRRTLYPLETSYPQTHMVHTYVQLNAGQVVDAIYSSGYGIGGGELTVIPLAIF